MKRTPPPTLSQSAPTRRRIPTFHPVPVAARKHGWTPQRQAAFIGYLAETRSVSEAAQRVAMGRESAYRLRKRPGAAGFAAAWDAALGVPHIPVNLTNAKATELTSHDRLQARLARTIMRRGRYAATHWKEDDNALL